MRGEQARGGVPTARSEESRVRVARLVTELLSPMYLVPGLLLLLAWRFSETAWDALRWGALAAGLTTLLPVAYLRQQMRSGKVSDHNVRVREQRPLFLFVSIVCILLALIIVTAGGAPQELRALVAAQATGLIVFTIVTFIWKISFHTGVAAGTVVILVLAFGMRLLMLAPIIMLSAWARVTLRDHTPAQVMAGAMLGALVAGTVFHLFR